MTSRRKAGTALLCTLFVFVGLLMTGPVKAENASSIQTQPVQAPFTPAQPEPLLLTTLACCLDEWQPGNCPSGYRVFAYCGYGCENCGSFTCVPSTTRCLR